MNGRGECENEEEQRKNYNKNKKVVSTLSLQGRSPKGTHSPLFVFKHERIPTAERNSRQMQSTQTGGQLIDYIYPVKK